MFHHLDVGWQPVYAPQVSLVEPSCRLVLKQSGMPFNDVAPVAMHCEVEFSVVPLHCAKLFAHFDCHVEFLVNLTLECLLGSLMCFNFSSREFPSPFHVAISAFGGKNSPFFVDNYGGYHFYAFIHEFSVLFHKGKK